MPSYRPTGTEPDDNGTEPDDILVLLLRGQLQTGTGAIFLQVEFVLPTVHTVLPFGR